MNQRYIPKLPCTSIVLILSTPRNTHPAQPPHPPPKKNPPSKLPPSNLLLVCMTVRELWTLAAPELGYSRKKLNRGVADMEFPGALKKQKVDVPGANNKKNRISRGDQEKIMWIFQGSQFQVLKFPRSVTQFCGVSQG